MLCTTTSPHPEAPTQAPAPAQLQPGFRSLGPDFYSDVRPASLPSPYLVALSESAAALLQWDCNWLRSPAGIHMLAGNTWPEGADAELHPYASVYSGHQFGVWAGQLGDGRALNLGSANGMEIQLKGSGLTPYSRMGDGRAVLRSSIREFLCSEAMAALGIPTTRALSVVGSDHPVYRETVETAAVVVRAAPSFIRFGHFEHFCHHGLHRQLRLLVDHVIAEHYPRCAETHGAGDSSNTASQSPVAAMLEQVVDRTARMVALWQSVGFCHGVMNTDNMSILGQTLDYGPFQFMDTYAPDHICNHSDTQGRYSFARQPAVAYWNLACLAQALVPLEPNTEVLVRALETYKQQYAHHFAGVMQNKLGMTDPAGADDTVNVRLMQELIQDLYALMGRDTVDHTIFWRRLSHWTRACDLSDPSVRDLFADREAADSWLARYVNSVDPAARHQRSAAMLKANPKFVLRNHLGQLAIEAAQKGDFTVTQQLLRVLQNPYDEHPEHAEWADFAPSWAQSIAISCSS